MGTTLDNGIYLPDEGERNCYDGLAGNWVALDNHLGSTNIHVTINDKQAWDGHVADTTIHVTSADKQAWNGHIADSVKHVTAEDKQAWNGKADASALTAHTGDTTIHVTAEDKQAWNGKADASALTAHTGDTTIHVTAEDKAKWDAVTSKADDSDVVHKSGNETITGAKTIKGVDLKFESKIGEYGVSSGNASLNFYDKNSLLLSYIKQGVYNSGLSYQTFNILGYNSNNQQVNKSISFSSSNLDLSTVFLKPDTDNVISLGRGSNRWSGIYATNYYYGSDNIEFSTKFVTTDTAQDISANKNFKGLITTRPDSPLWGGTNNTTADITSLALNCFHIETRLAGTLLDLSNGAWCVAQIGTGCFFFRHNTGTDIRFKHFNTNKVSKICVMSNDNKFISNLCPNTTNSYNLGDSTNKWATINGLSPSSLGMPDIDNKIDISSYITDLTGVNNEYTPSVNGWISIRSSNATKISILDSATNIGNQSVSNTATYLTVMTPCIANKKVYINIVCASLSHAYFIPCQGNV